MNLDDLLRIAVERGASDLHIKAGARPVLRIDGTLLSLEEQEVLPSETTAAMAYGLLAERQRERFQDVLQIDVSHSIPGLGRFRVNIFQQRGAISLVARVIPTRIHSISDLLLPPVIETIAEEPRGLVLCTGTTGSGKSTTLAAMVEHINARRTEHIITIEDPIEFLHRDQKSVINQRELGVDTYGFGPALRAALRQDPDIILVGEMRDLETIETALLAAETGHLVLSTLHTLDATETINRAIAVFPPHQQTQIRIQLSQVLRAVISLRLLPRADGTGRVPAVEVMRATPLIREFIEVPEKTKYIRDQIALGTSEYAMQTFDQSLSQLYNKELISLDEAMRRASNPDEFRLKLEGIHSTADAARDQMESTLRSAEGLGDGRLLEIEQG